MPLLLLTFLVISLGSWAVVVALFGHPAPVYASLLPAPALIHLKHLEMRCYAVLAFGIPFTSAWIAGSIACRWMHQPKNLTVENNNQPLRWIEWGIYTLVFPVLLFGLSPKPQMNIPLDDGIRLAVTQAVMDGRTPYKNIFLLYGPLSQIALPRLAFAVGGQRVVALRLLDWCLSGAPPLMLFAWAAATLRNRRWLWVFLAMAASRLSFLIPMRMFFPLASLTLFSIALRQMDSARRWTAAAAGSFIVLSGLYSWEGGLLLAAAYGGYFLITFNVQEKWRQDFILLGVGAGIIFLPCGIWLCMHGAWHAFFRNAWDATTAYAGVGGKPTPPLHFPLTQSLRHPFTFFDVPGVWMRWWFPAFLYSAALAACLYRRFLRIFETDDHAFLLCALSGLFFFVVALGRSDFDHWIKATPPVWVLLMLLVERCGRQLRRPVGNAFVAGLAILFLVRYMLDTSTPLAMAASFQRMTFRPVPALSPSEPLAPLQKIGRLPLPDWQTDDMRDFLNHVSRQAPPGSPVFILLNAGFYYFLGGYQNPTPYSLEGEIASESMIDQTIEALSDSPSACVVVCDTHGSWTQYDYLGNLDAYLHSRYHVVDAWKNYRLLRLNSSKAKPV